MDCRDETEKAGQCQIIFLFVFYGEIYSIQFVFV